MPTEIDRSALAILAGEGELPLRLVHYCLDHDIPVCAVQFEGCVYNDFGSIPILKTRLEKVGEIFNFLKTNKSYHVVMIGNLHKPDIASLRPDFRGLKTLGKIAGSFLKGDDNLLRSLRGEIEKEGFIVRGIDYYLNDLTVDAGCLTQRFYDVQQNMDKAVQEALRFGAQDKGQSILCHSDGTYSYETQKGTTALITQHGQKGSVLVKMVKPQQDPDLDRPTVGINTLKALRDKGCAGMVIQADGVFLVGKDEMIEYANNYDMFIEAVDG